MSACVISPLGKDKDGYPRIKYARRSMRASRLLWKIMFGEIEDGQLVLHKCDNTSCVNPDHLYLGTFERNMQDKVDRSRVAGDHHPRAKVTENQIKEMKLLYEEGMSQQKIGNLYGIGQSQVSAILRGKRLATKVR